MQQYFGFRRADELIVYVEKFNRRIGYLLFDFVDSNEFTFFDSVVGLNYNWENRPTMVELTNYFQRPVQEGTYYILSRETLNTLIDRILIVEDSLIIGFTINILSQDSSLFIKAKSFDSFERFFRRIDQPSQFPIDDFSSKQIQVNKVIVRNVGQGNWNELLHNDKFQIVYDFGTIYTTKRNEVLRLIGNRDNEYQNSKPIFILSHWDVDHYHMLLGFQDPTITTFQAFIYRSDIPNLTARKALGRISLLNPSSLMPLCAEDPYPKRSSQKLEQISLTKCKSLLLYNSYRNRSRNKSGIGLSFRNSRTNVVFSGDYDYSQVSDSILPTLNYESEHYLVVPHHGGNAGKFTYKSTKVTFRDAIVSVGKNPYKPSHPHRNNLDSLRQQGFSIVRTDVLNSDYILHL